MSGGAVALGGAGGMSGDTVDAPGSAVFPLGVDAVVDVNEDMPEVVDAASAVMPGTVPASGLEPRV
jgi:hypothetical protein